MADSVHYEIMNLDALTRWGACETNQFCLFPRLVWPCSYVPNYCRGEKTSCTSQGVKRQREQGVETNVF